MAGLPLQHCGNMTESDSGRRGLLSQCSYLQSCSLMAPVGSREQSICHTWFTANIYLTEQYFMPGLTAPCCQLGPSVNVSADICTDELQSTMQSLIGVAHALLSPS